MLKVGDWAPEGSLSFLVYFYRSLHFSMKMFLKDVQAPLQTNEIRCFRGLEAQALAGFGSSPGDDKIHPG